MNKARGEERKGVVNASVLFLGAFCRKCWNSNRILITVPILDCVVLLGHACSGAAVHNDCILLDGCADRKDRSPLIGDGHLNRITITSRLRSRLVRPHSFPSRGLFVLSRARRLLLNALKDFTKSFGLYSREPNVLSDCHEVRLEARLSGRIG
jgi:hypothetical protein